MGKMNLMSCSILKLSLTIELYADGEIEFRPPGISTKVHHRIPKVQLFPSLPAQYNSFPKKSKDSSNLLAEIFY